MSLEKRAHIFAKRAHASIDQRRRYTDDPYIVHPVAVAAIVKTVRHTPAMVAAALLHDVVEDTPVTIEQIEAEFGIEVCTLVSWLTHVSTSADGNRVARKNLDHAHLMQAPAEAQTIKYADIIDNAVSIRKHDPDFWRTYQREMRQLLVVMNRGDQALLARAQAAVE